MLLQHAAIHFPEQVSLDLWPFAIDHAIYLWNWLPIMKWGLAPIELFNGIHSNLKVLRLARVLECPVYVWDPTIQDGKRGYLIGSLRVNVVSSLGYLNNMLALLDRFDTPEHLEDKILLRLAGVWECPVYMLDPTIQDGKKLSCWKPQSRRGQFLGISKQHASSVGLIRHLTTG